MNGEVVERVLTSIRGFQEIPNTPPRTREFDFELAGDNAKKPCLTQSDEDLKSSSLRSSGSRKTSHVVSRSVVASLRQPGSNSGQQHSPNYQHGASGPGAPYTLCR